MDIDIYPGEQIIKKFVVGLVLNFVQQRLTNNHGIPFCLVHTEHNTLGVQNGTLLLFKEQLNVPFKEYFFLL